MSGLVDSFIPGFVGEPGHRTFYLQVDHAGTRSWYLAEKGQVAALAVDAGRLLAELDLEDAGEALPVGELAEPEGVSFRIGRIDLAHDAPSGTMVLTLTPVDEGGQPVAYHLSAAQLGAAARAAVAAVLAGRPHCPRCGLAMDPEGHVCPLGNGDLRGFRP